MNIRVQTHPQQGRIVSLLIAPVLLVFMLLFSMPVLAERPSRVDYCEMLEQEIQGRKHAFLAGNLTYYVGGRYNCWKPYEDETLGLTHPFYHDLRGRGFGLVEHEDVGFGHDFRGWEFYKESKVAYGTIVVEGREFLHPTPTSMIWRPDRVVCTYQVGGVNIREEKFIAENDAACSIIISDHPIILRFEGRSLSIPQLTLEDESHVRFDDENNAVHIAEGGCVTTHPVRDETHTGRLIYDGMHTVLTTSVPIDSHAISTDEQERRTYSFEVSCDAGDEGVAIVWSMADDYASAIQAAKTVLDNPIGERDAKTAFMNDLLNEQVPYFRCSDDEIVNVYYFLWAIYLMYYTDVQQGWEMHPHTQTAVNNFLGMHRYDANFQIMVGAWTENKEYYAYGNVLHWRPLLPFAKPGGSLPDNKGIDWFSPVWGTTTEHVLGAWHIYEHTGDVQFLHECYDDYFRVLFEDGMHSHWGCHYDAATRLRDMAVLTGDREDPERWLEMVHIDHREHWLENMWESRHPNYFGGGSDRLGWSGFAYMRNSRFPQEWARLMTETWAIDSEDGFWWTIPLSTDARSDFDQVSDVFTSTPDTNYYAVKGMYASQVGRAANTCALAHLKSYNMEWGIPIAPEAWSLEPHPWGDQYSNFNAGKILWILEGMAGINYSLPENQLTIRDCMPETWSEMELRIPMTVDGVRYWPRIVYRREVDEIAGTVKKTIDVTGNPLGRLKIEPWLEEGTLINRLSNETSTIVLLQK